MSPANLYFIYAARVVAAAPHAHLPLPAHAVDARAGLIIGLLAVRADAPSARPASGYGGARGSGQAKTFGAGRCGCDMLSADDLRSRARRSIIERLSAPTDRARGEDYDLAPSLRGCGAVRGLGIFVARDDADVAFVFDIGRDARSMMPGAGQELLRGGKRGRRYFTFTDAIGMV